MAMQPGQQARSPVWAVFVGQALITALSGLCWLLFAGSQESLAAIAGGLIAILPGAYLAVRVLSVPADAEPKRLLVAFYRGEALKFGLTVVLFILALQWFGDVFGPLITTYILAILMYWLAFRVGAAKPR